MVTLLTALLVQALVLLFLAGVAFLLWRPPMNWNLPIPSSPRSMGWDNVQILPRRSGSQRQQIVRQMGSRRNPQALEAVRMAREEGWLSDGSLRRISLRLANLQGADLEGADLEGVDLSYASLVSAQLAGANLRQAHLTQANLSDTRLDGADLRGADLNAADLRGTTLTATLYNHQTRWPQGFDPAAAAIDVDRLVVEEQRRLLRHAGEPR